MAGRGWLLGRGFQFGANVDAVVGESVVSVAKGARICFGRIIHGHLKKN